MVKAARLYTVVEVAPFDKERLWMDLRHCGDQGLYVCAAGVMTLHERPCRSPLRPRIGDLHRSSFCYAVIAIVAPILFLSPRDVHPCAEWELSRDIWNTHSVSK
ncbi:hypothetical protein MRX96_017434 [Rhipicephalus microplus]